MKCNFTDCQKDFDTPVVSLNLHKLYDDAFNFCSVNHALYFLAFPEKHWPETDGDLNIGITA